MDDINNLASLFETLLKQEAWHPSEARALLRAGRALAREKGQPGTFDMLLFEPTPVPPGAA